MFENYSLADIIRLLIFDCQSGFFLYTLVYFGLRFSKGKQKLREFDYCATLVICSVCVLFLLVWFGASLYYWNISDESRAALLNRISGKYAFAYWLQPTLYCIIPQFLWFQKIRENYISRFLIAFFLFFSFEKFVIIVTSLHRDYLPSSWTIYSDSIFPNIIYGILWKFVLFTGLTSLLFSFRRKRDNFAL